MLNFDTYAKQLFESVKSYVAKEIKPFIARVESVENEIKTIALIKGDDGKDGLNGTDGKDGVNGIDGKSVSIEEVKPVISEVAATIISEKLVALNIVSGKDGIDGKDGINGIDGKSISIEELLPIVDDTVNAAIKTVVADIPTPKDGINGKDGVDGKSIDESIVLAHINEQVKTLVANIPLPANGKDGKDGIDGKDGVSVDQAALYEHVDEVVAKTVGLIEIKNGVDGKDGQNGKDGINGVDGKDAEPIDKFEALSEVKSYVGEFFGSEEFKNSVPTVKGEQGEKGLDGKDGVDGKDGEKGQDGKDAVDGVNGIDGKDGQNGLDGKDGVDGKDGTNGKDGIDGKNGEDGKQGEKGLDGQNGKDGINGEHGKDALQLDILDLIDTEKQYSRNTYAHFNGGLIRSFKATEPLSKLSDSVGLEQCGWHIIVNGLSSIEVNLEDEQSLSVKFFTTDGKVANKQVTFPYMVYKGIWTDGEYSKNQTATYGGSLWVCVAEKTFAKPGVDNSDWQLAVKKGREGKDGKDGQRGERGLEGKKGKDLTQIDLKTGQKWSE